MWKYGESYLKDKIFLLERKLEYSSSSFEVCLRNISILFLKNK